MKEYHYLYNTPHRKHKHRIRFFPTRQDAMEYLHHLLLWDCTRFISLTEEGRQIV